MSRSIQFDPASHAQIVHELLSPAGTSLPASIPTSVALSLATLSDAELSTFVRILLGSPALWRGTSAPLPFQRSRDIFTAIHRGLLLRVEAVKEDYGTGWRARRRLYYVLDAMLSPLDAEVPPVLRLLASSAILCGFQSVKARKDPLYTGGRNLQGKTELAVIAAWNAVLQDEDLGSADAFLLPCWLATCALPGIDSTQLSSLPLEPLLDLLLRAVSHCFADGRLFDNMEDDLSKTEEGLQWHDPSPSRALLSSIHDSPLFAELGRLSQVIGKVIESVNTAEGLETVREHLSRLERLAQRANAGWLRHQWSEITDDADLSPSLRSDAAGALPWTMLKTLLFSLTMIHSSLISLLTSAPADEPAELTLDLAACSIRTFSWLYFVTSRFGSDGFGAYRGVWYGALDLANRATDPKRIEGLARNVEPARGEEGRSVPYAATYYLNIVEQIIDGLPDDYLETSVLPIAERWLQDTEHRDAFEAAHSVVLAVYQKNKRCADALAPWYTSLLLKSYPERLSAPQLRLAYTAVIRHASDTSDPLAWLCVQKLTDTIDTIPVTASNASPLGGTDKADLSTLQQTKKDDGDGKVRQSEPRPQDEEEAHIAQSDEALYDVRLTPLETRVLSLPRGALLLCLVEALGAVNLTLLLSALEKVERLAREEPAGEAKRALLRCVLASLANQDAAKRVHAVAWWSEHGPKLWSGAAEEEAEVAV